MNQMEASDQNSEINKPYFRFSLRTLMFVSFVVSIALAFRKPIIDAYDFAQYHAYENGIYSGHPMGICLSRNFHLDRLARSGRIAKIVRTYPKSAAVEYLDIAKSEESPPSFAVCGKEGKNKVITVYTDNVSKTKWKRFVANFDP
jgi:hypothetical protein